MPSNLVAAEVMTSVRHEIAGHIDRSFHWLALIRRVAEEPETDLSRVLPRGTTDKGGEGLKLVGELEGEYRQLEKSLRKLGLATRRSVWPDG